MKELTKAQKRRERVLDNYWFNKYGDKSNPAKRTLMTWKHLGMPRPR